MKDLRMLGSMIKKLSQENDISINELREVFQCSSEQIYAIFEGRLFPSFEELQIFSKKTGTTVSDLLQGDEEYYNKRVVHCMGKFENKNNREKILDIIEDYLTLLNVTAE